MERAERASSDRARGSDDGVDGGRLDGNVAAGILSELFVPDVTTARATCAGCDTTRAVGALIVYAHGMGMVARCPGCDAVVLRVARTNGRLWLDATGARRIVIASAAGVG